MSNDELYIENKVPGRIYGGKSFRIETRVMKDGKLEKIERHARFIDRVFEDVQGDAFGIVKDELVLRSSPTGKRQIKLYVIEDPRKIGQLIVQSFTVKGDGSVPTKDVAFSLRGQEIDEFLELAGLARNADFQSSGKFRIGINQLQRIDVSDDAVRALLGSNTGLIESLLKNEVTEHDVVAIGYRKKQLKHFEQLLTDPDFFEAEKTTTNSAKDEDVWQAFFEKNHWIFGGALFLSATGAIDQGKLQRAVAGSTVAGAGKITDALLRTRGRISALCFVEIKTHTTPLLVGTEYRPGVWTPSRELVGAIAQSQKTVEAARRTIDDTLRPTDKQGNPTAEEAFLVAPRTVVVAGNLAQFETEFGINRSKYESFEMYRRHLTAPEVITYDELYERARLVLEINQN